MLINEGLILLDFEAGSKEEAINKMAEIAAKEGKITSVGEFTKTVFARESHYSTGVGNGIAIPHGKSGAVKEAVVVFGKTAKGIDWNALDGEPVNLVFLLGVPEENVDNVHLKVLSQLSRKLMDEQFVEQLKNMCTSQEIINAFADISFQ